MVPGLFSKLRFADISANAEAHTGTPSVSSATEPNPGAMDRVVSTPDAESTVARFVEVFPGAPSFVPLALFGDLPLDVQRDAANQKGGTGAIKGAFKHGKVYLVAGNHRSLSDFEATIFHETLGHAGVRRMLGDDFVGQLNKLFVAMGGVGGLQGAAWAATSSSTSRAPGPRKESTGLVQQTVQILARCAITI